DVPPGRRAVDRRERELRGPEGRLHGLPAALLRVRRAERALPPILFSVYRAIGGDRPAVCFRSAQGPLAGTVRRGAGAPAGGAQLRPRPGALHRLCVRLGPRATDDAALWYRRPAPVLRRRPAFPEAILMNIPENWLRDFVAVKTTTEKLAHLLTMSGLEVE